MASTATVQWWQLRRDESTFPFQRAPEKPLRDRLQELLPADLLAQLNTEGKEPHPPPELSVPLRKEHRKSGGHLRSSGGKSKRTRKSHSPDANRLREIQSDINGKDRERDSEAHSPSRRRLEDKDKMKSIGRRQKSRDRAKARDVKKATKNEKKSKSSDDVKVSPRGSASEGDVLSEPEQDSGRAFGVGKEPEERNLSSDALLMDSPVDIITANFPNGPKTEEDLDKALDLILQEHDEQRANDDEELRRMRREEAALAAELLREGDNSEDELDLLLADLQHERRRKASISSRCSPLRSPGVPKQSAKAVVLNSPSAIRSVASSKEKKPLPAIPQQVKGQTGSAHAPSKTDRTASGSKAGKPKEQPKEDNDPESSEHKMERQELDGKDDLDALLEEFSPNDLDSALDAIVARQKSINEDEEGPYVCVPLAQVEKINRLCEAVEMEVAEVLITDEWESIRRIVKKMASMPLTNKEAGSVKIAGQTTFSF